MHLLNLCGGSAKAARLCSEAHNAPELLICMDWVLDASICTRLRMCTPSTGLRGQEIHKSCTLPLSLRPIWDSMQRYSA